MIKAKPKFKRKNPKTFKEAILERLDKSIAEQKKLLKEQKSYTHYIEAPVVLEVLKILKRSFKSEDSNDYSNNIVISELKQIMRELKTDAYNYGGFD